MSEASPTPGRAYTPEQVHENGWLGEITPGAMRAAVSHGDWPCTKVRGKVHFTAEDIAWILDAGREKAKKQAPAPLSSRRGRRTPPDLSIVPSGAPLLKADPSRARRSRKRSA